MISQAHYLDNEHGELGVDYIFSLDNYQDLIKFLWQKANPNPNAAEPPVQAANVSKKELLTY